MNHKDTMEMKNRSNDLSKTIVDAVIKVHRELGP